MIEAAPDGAAFFIRGRNGGGGIAAVRPPS